MKTKQKSLRQLARELGVNHSYLSQIKYDKRPASIKVLSKSNQQILKSAERGNRTHTPVKEADFKSAASTVPPSRHYNFGGGERVRTAE